MSGGRLRGTGQPVRGRGHWRLLAGVVGTNWRRAGQHNWGGEFDSRKCGFPYTESYHDLEFLKCGAENGVQFYLSWHCGTRTQLVTKIPGAMLNLCLEAPVRTPSKSLGEQKVATFSGYPTF